MNVFRVGLVSAACVVGSLFVLACSQPYQGKKGLVVECDDESTSEDCEDRGSGNQARRSSTNTGDPSTPSGSQDYEPEPEPTPSANADAGSDGAAPIGPSCTALAACCENLQNAGITGSARQCREVVDDRNEFSCMNAHTSFKTPDDFYDPVCF